LKDAILIIFIPLILTVNQANITLLQSSCLEEIITAAGNPASRHDRQNFATESGREETRVGNPCQGQLSATSACQDTMEDHHSKKPAEENCTQYRYRPCNDKRGTDADQDQNEPSGAVNLEQNEGYLDKGGQKRFDGSDGGEVDPLGLVATLRERLQQMTIDLERVKAAADRLHERMDEPDEKDCRTASSFADGRQRNLSTQTPTAMSHTSAESLNLQDNVASQLNKPRGETESTELLAPPNHFAFWQQPMRNHLVDGQYPMANLQPSNKRYLDSAGMCRVLCIQSGGFLKNISRVSCFLFWASAV
jgi:hypothetical protein